MNIGWEAIAGAYGIAAGLALLPFPGARVVAGLVTMMIIIIDIK